MTFLFMLIGAALGAFFCGGMFDEPTGATAALFGALVGLLLGMQRKLRARIAALEQVVLRAPAAPADAASASATPVVSAAPAPEAKTTAEPVSDSTPAIPAGAPAPAFAAAAATTDVPAVSEMRLETPAPAEEPARP